MEIADLQYKLKTRRITTRFKFWPYRSAISTFLFYFKYDIKYDISLHGIDYDDYAKKMRNYLK